MSGECDICGSSEHVESYHNGIVYESRFDCYNALRARAEKAEAERDELREALRWIPVGDMLPQNRQSVAVQCEYRHSIKIIVAEYISPRSVREEDFMDPDYAEGGDYEEETDTYWTPSGFYENGVMQEINWFIDIPIIAWMPLPEPPTP